MSVQITESVKDFLVMDFQILLSPDEDFDGGYCFGVTSARPSSFRPAGRLWTTES